MKTTFKISALMVLAVLFMAVPVSCKKTKDSGKMTVAMTDAPALYSHVYVDVKGVTIHSDNTGWITLPVNQGVYDLLSLQNNISVVLVNNASIPVGPVSQLRLELGGNNTLVDTLGISYPLTIPSGSESGLKINVQQTIVPNNSVEILLDFDANASIVREGNGSFKLKPVIKVKSVITH